MASGEGWSWSVTVNFVMILLCAISRNKWFFRIDLYFKGLRTSFGQISLEIMMWTYYQFGDPGTMENLAWVTSGPRTWIRTTSGVLPLSYRSWCTKFTESRKTKIMSMGYCDVARLDTLFISQWASNSQFPAYVLLRKIFCFCIASPKGLFAFIVWAHWKQSGKIVARKIFMFTVECFRIQTNTVVTWLGLHRLLTHQIRCSKVCRCRHQPSPL